MVYSIIFKRKLEGAQRLDAEYYQPEFLEVRERLQSIPHLVLGDYAFVTDGEHGSVEFEEDGIKYLTAESVTEGFLKLDDIRYVSEKVDKRNRRATLQSSDVTLSIKGTIGLAALVFSNDLPANMNRDVSRIHIKDEIDPYFLTVFLNSKFGKNQTLRESSGNVQQMITLSRIRELLVPKLPHEFISQIKDKYLECYELLQKSKQDYIDAENLLLEELGLVDFQISDDLAFEVNFSEVENANRMDADYFQPKYDKLFKVSKIPFYSLREITTFLNHGKQPPYTDEPGVPIITQRHLSQYSPQIDALSDEETKQTTLEWCEQNKKYQLKCGDLLYYSVGAYIGKTNVILEDVGKIVPAGFLTLIRVNEKLVDPVYLTVVLNSVVGQLQSDKWQSATAQSYIYPKDIRNFKIPVLPMKTQKQIADLVRKSHAARKKSKELLEEAKRKVEEMIENGGERNG